MHGVLEVVGAVGDAVGPADDLALDGGRRGPRPRVVADAVERLHTQVQGREHDVGAPRAVVVAALDVGVERVLGGVTAGAVSAVVAERDRVGQRHIHPDPARHRDGRLRHLHAPARPICTELGLSPLPEPGQPVGDGTVARIAGRMAGLIHEICVGQPSPLAQQLLMTDCLRPGHRYDAVYLSGGVGVAYKPEQRSNDILAIGEGVRKKFEEILVPAGMGDVAIFTEMGRFMLAPYGCLVATAIHEKHIYKEYIGLDACAANLMRPAMYGSYHHITVLGKENAPCDHKYDVVGGLCENNDKFAIDRMLPKIDMGDVLVIHDTGAHGFSMGYNYNGKLRSAEVLLCEDGSHRLIRRAETPADYFATFDFTPFYKKMGL